MEPAIRQEVNSRKRKCAPSNTPKPTKKAKREAVVKVDPKLKPQSMRKFLAKKTLKKAKAARFLIVQPPVVKDEDLYSGDDGDNRDMTGVVTGHDKGIEHRVRVRGDFLRHDNFENSYETDPLGKAFDDFFAADKNEDEKIEVSGDHVAELNLDSAKDTFVRDEDLAVESIEDQDKEEEKAIKHVDLCDRYYPVHAHINYHGPIADAPGVGLMPTAFPTIPSTFSTAERDIAANTIATAYSRQLDQSRDHFSWWLEFSDVFKVLQKYGHCLSTATIVNLEKLLKTMLDLEKDERRRQALDPSGSLTVEHGYSLERLERDFGAGVFDPDYDYADEDFSDAEDFDDGLFVLNDQPIFSAIELGVLDKKGNVTIPKPGEKRHYGTLPIDW